MESYGDAWVQCEWCYTSGKALRILPPGVPAIINVDGLGALICEPCMDMGPPSHLSAWIDWHRQQPRSWDTRVVNRGVGYEMVAVSPQAMAQSRKESYKGYEPTGGKGNGVKGKRDEPVPQGKGEIVKEERWRVWARQPEEGQGEAISQVGGFWKACEAEASKQGKGKDGHATPMGRIYV